MISKIERMGPWSLILIAAALIYFSTYKLEIAIPENIFDDPKLYLLASGAFSIGAGIWVYFTRQGRLS